MSIKRSTWVRHRRATPLQGLHRGLAGCIMLARPPHLSGRDGWLWESLDDRFFFCLHKHCRDVGCIEESASLRTQGLVRRVVSSRQATSDYVMVEIYQVVVRADTKQKRKFLSSPKHYAHSIAEPCW